jgi:chemotaxis protein histidine kinase CheA
MLDVMVLSVLALTSRNLRGGSSNIPMPASGLSRVVEEGLRNETGYKNEIARLETQLAASSELARKAIEQAALADAKAERERAERSDALAKLREAELNEERAKSQAVLAAREAELVNEQAAAAKARTRELEQRELEAKARADAAHARVKLAEQKAAEAEQLAREAERSAGERDTEILALKEDAMRARVAKQMAEERALELSASLANQAAELRSAKSAEAAATAKAEVALNERERLEVKTEQVAEELVEARVSVATLEERNVADSEKLAQLEREQKAAAEARNQSVWVRRDEAMRRVMISYTEYASNGRSYRTDKQLAMPLVNIGGFNLVPAEFTALGLKKSFFGGLSDRIADVRGIAAPMVGEAKADSLRALIVPATEPQVCLAHVIGPAEGALEPITMQGLKDRRLRTAMLFSPEDVNAYGLVEVVPMIGKDYLSVRVLSKAKPKVGDYLLTDRGEFVGVMVKSDICYVLPDQLSSTPKPVIIPLRSYGKRDVYLNDFVKNLNLARDLFKQEQDSRGF